MKNKGKQERSRATVGTILDSAAWVLIEFGYDNDTTAANAFTSCHAAAEHFYIKNPQWQKKQQRDVAATTVIQRVA